MDGLCVERWRRERGGQHGRRRTKRRTKSDASMLEVVAVSAVGTAAFFSTTLGQLWPQSGVGAVS